MLKTQLCGPFCSFQCLDSSQKNVRLRGCRVSGMFRLAPGLRQRQLRQLGHQGGGDPVDRVLPGLEGLVQQQDQPGWDMLGHLSWTYFLGEKYGELLKQKKGGKHV